MTQLIDLMPNSALQRLGRARRIQRWLLLFFVTVVILTSTAGLQQMKRGALETEVFHTRAQTQGIAEHRIQAARIQSDLAQLIWTQFRHDDLTWSVRMHDVLQVIASLTPESVTLTSVTIASGQGRRMGFSTPGISRRGETNASMTLEIVGLAGTDIALANLLKGFEGHLLFESVVVDFSRETTNRDLNAREFGITCRISLEEQYHFAQVFAEESE